MTIFVMPLAQHKPQKVGFCGVAPIDLMFIRPYISTHWREKFAMSKGKTVGITPPQAKTLRVICNILVRTGLPPTVKELACALGISHASAHEQIAQLVRKGYLRKEDRKARSIVVIKRDE